MPSSSDLDNPVHSYTALVENLSHLSGILVVQSITVRDWNLFDQAMTFLHTQTEDVLPQMLKPKYND